jgi:exosortase
MATGISVVVNRRTVGELLRSGWVQWIWIGALFLAAFRPTIVGTIGSWFDDGINMQHGLLVPFVAAYMVWAKQEVLKRIPQAPNYWGIAIVSGAALIWMLSLLTQWVWVSRMALLLGLTGCILALHGFRMVRALAYPLCTLVLMIAPPTFVSERVTLQLQLLASRLGEISLETLGYSVLREGNILEMVGEKLAVAEACSGIRSLTSLIFLAVAYNYFFVPKRSIRIIMLLAVVPVAILCNSGRIVATGIVGQYNRELAHGMLHETFGYFGLTLGAILLLLLHRVIVSWQSKESTHHA